MSYPPCDCLHNAWSHGTRTGYPREGEPCHAAVIDADGQITDQECACPGYHCIPGDDERSEWLAYRDSKIYDRRD